jgi:hypothetical protein
MPQTPRTIEDVLAEADTLEFDVSLEDGFLDLKKRGSGNPCYSSTQTYDSPVVIQDAWNFLQRYRSFLQKMDQERSK